MKIKAEDLRAGDIVLTVDHGKGESVDVVDCVDGGRVWTHCLHEGDVNDPLMETFEELNEEYEALYLLSSTSRRDNKQ